VLCVNVTLLGFLIITLKHVYRQKQRRIVKRYIGFLGASAVLYSFFPGYCVVFTVNYIRVKCGLSETYEYWDELAVSHSQSTVIVVGTLTGAILAAFRIAEVHPKLAQDEMKTEVSNVYSRLTEDLMTECILFTLFSLHMLFKKRSHRGDDAINTQLYRLTMQEVQVTPSDILGLGEDAWHFEADSESYAAKYLNGKVTEIEGEAFMELRDINFTTEADLMQ
jgi:hypothetical protein